MSKISEQKALEAYPIKHIVLPFCFSIPDLNESYRKPYQEGYDQAMQDFLEKAEIYLKTRVYYNMHPSNVTITIQEFKNYMKNE